LQFALHRELLPEAYLYGLAYFLGGSARRLAYLNGEESMLGWWYYFPEAFLLKTAPAVLLLLVWLAGAGLVRRRWCSFDAWFLVLPPAGYLAVSMTSHLNIGHRHLAPIYPVIFVALGSLAGVARGSRVRAAALGLAAAGMAWSFWAASPRYLSYFNLLAGGPAGAPRYLLDSNLDWGQDLRRLALWIERHGIGEVHLAYFGTADPRAYGIRFRKVYLVHDFYPQLPAERPPAGSVLAVSVNLLYGLYHDEDRELAEALYRRGWIDWGPIREWLRLRDERTARLLRHPSFGEWIASRNLVEPARLEEVRATLLARGFERVRTSLRPIGQAGDSIYLYRIPEGPGR
jgi:hypothetical protein